MLKFKTKEEKKLKVLIYGLDGTGKSTLAEKYCEKKGLKPVCIDMDDTNFTDVPCVDFKMITNPHMITKQIEDVIRDVVNHPDFDTLIIDGMGSLIDLLTPPPSEKAKGQQAYLIRSQNFQKIWKCLIKSKLNIIMIGQKDLIVDEEKDSSKLSEKINNMVDWKFKCERDGNKFINYCTKWRREKEEPL